MKKYDEYKKCSSSYIKEIPSHWSINKLNNEIDILTDYVANGSFESLAKNVQYLDEPDYAILLRTQDYNKNFEGPFVYISEKSYKFLNKSKLKKGDLIISNVGSIGTIFKVPKLDRPSSLAPNAILLRTKQNNDYIYYFIKSNIGQKEIEDITSFTAQPKFNKTSFRTIKLLIPPLEEQAQIVRYLDKKTLQIDNLINKKEELIKTLKTSRQKLILETITKGLDKDVEMKDSGVEWIGEIPSYWKLKKLRYLGELQNGISKGAEEFGYGYPFVSYGDVYKNLSLPFKVEGLVNSSISDRKTYSVQEGDVFFTRTSETIEEIGFASTCLQTLENATFAGFLIRFRPTTNDLYKGYSKYYFRSDIHRRFFVKEMNLVTRASLGQNLLKNLPVVIPPYEEQIKIANYLEEKTSEINDVIVLIREQIELLKKAKQKLITEAVTGKIDVREQYI